MAKNKFIIFFCFVTCLLLLSSCNSLSGQGQTVLGDTRSFMVGNGKNIGQSFVSKNSGLNGIRIYLDVGDQPVTGELVLHLQQNRGGSDILESSLSLSSIDKEGYYLIQFPTQPNSYFQAYYVWFEIRGSGVVYVGTANGSSYLDGSLYGDQTPADSQLTFTLFYSTAWVFIGIGRQLLDWLIKLGLVGLIFVIPGWALLSLLWVRWEKFDVGLKISLAATASLALYPVVILLTGFFNIKAGIWNAIVPIVISMLFLLWKSRRRLKQKFQWKTALRVDLPDALFMVVAILIFGTRFWAIRGMAFPMWGDSYQHTMITQLFLDQKGLFQSWLPYVPYKSLTVQFGFPADVAIYSWLSGESATAATLWIGQIINALAVINLYPFALKLSNGKKWVGVFAVLIAGILMPMPMMYVNWGRYAQLTGQAILPTAIMLCWDLFENQRPKVREIFLTGLVITGMLLAYYRMFYYFSCFFIAWLLIKGFSERPLTLIKWKAWIFSALGVCSVVIILLFPWLRNVANSNLSEGIRVGIVAEPIVAGIQSDYSTWLGIFDYVPEGFVILAIISVFWNLLRKNWTALLLGLWVVFLAGIRAGQLIHLPGANMMQSFAVLIFLYAPTSLLVGLLTNEIIFNINKSFHKRIELLISIMVLVVAILGSIEIRKMANPVQYGYVTYPDIQAARWIEANVPEDAIILVEGYRIYGGDSAVGSDAGWWLPLSSHRRNTMPPQYALVNEKSEPEMYTKKVVDLIAVLEKNKPESLIARTALCDMGVTHIYIGQGQGNVGAGAVQLFNAKDFTNTQFYTQIYAENRVSIFSVHPDMCQAFANDLSYLP